MARIKIGTVQSMREPESFGCTPDDRQELVKCLNGVYVVDAGNFPAGDVFAVQAVFAPADWATLSGYWRSRTRVDVVDHNGVLLAGRRIVVKKYEYVKRHKYYQITLDIWGA